MTANNQEIMTLGELFKTAAIPDFLLKSSDEKDHEGIAMSTFQENLRLHQASSSTQQGTQRAPGFDYVRWKAHGTHRMHHNPDEYVQMCQGLAPYISSVAASSFEGLEERRWAGLTQAPPPIQGLPPKSGYSSVGGGGSRGGYLESQSRDAQ
ncbi:hypothetical protein HELRODRAFT_169796 [Helobdella robusta]|uniref:Uncharacterized protein n=1 Tax=Helobdella robusta TaxID=6412 RepID=T1F2B9_HELRO|nr:hypothetical protein HELRODRAFT_169796 [Helobdella robusta]ESO08069.1 hypothetical protein HELRODRAFT_169796 [Helobdella robusta]